MRKILVYVAAYVAWLAACAGGVAVLLMARGALAQLALMARLERSGFRLADQLTLLVGALVCLIMLMVSEVYFREGAVRGVLVQRVARVFAIEAGLAAVLYVVPKLLAAFL